MISMSECGNTCGCDRLTREELDANPPACPVMAEFRKPRAERLAAYRAEIDAAKLRVGVDVPYKLQQCGVPYDALAALRRQPKETRCMDFARRFLAAPRNLMRTLVLVGTNGVGKSTAAAYVLGDFVKRYPWNEGASGVAKHQPFRWVHSSEITSETDFGKVDPAFLEGLKKAECLVIDDLGKDATTPGLAALRDVMVVRHEKCRPTIVTSNLPPESPPSRPDAPSFKGLYGVSWYERLKVSAMVPDLRSETNLRARVDRDFTKRPTL